MPVRSICTKPAISADATDATVVSFNTLESRRTILSSSATTSCSTSPSLASRIRRRCRPQTPVEDDGTFSLSSLLDSFSFRKVSQPRATDSASPFEDGFIIVTSKKSGSESDRRPAKLVSVGHSQKATKTSGKAVLEQCCTATSEESLGERWTQAPTVPKCKDEENMALGERTAGHRSWSEKSQTLARSPLGPSCREKEALVPPEDESDLPASPTPICLLPRQKNLLLADVCNPHFLPSDADDATTSSASWITPALTSEERKKEQVALARRKILHQQRSAQQQQKERLSGMVLGNNLQSTSELHHDIAFPQKKQLCRQEGKRCKRDKGIRLGSYLESRRMRVAGGRAFAAETEERISQDELLSVFQWSTGLAAGTQQGTEDRSIQKAPQWTPVKNMRTATQDTFLLCHEAQPKSSDATGYKEHFRCNQASNNLAIKNNSVSLASVGGGRIDCHRNHNGVQSMESTHSLTSAPEGGHCTTPDGYGIIFPARTKKASSAKKPPTASFGPYRAKSSNKNRANQSMVSSLKRTTPKRSGSCSTPDAVVTTSQHCPAAVTPSDLPSTVLSNDDDGIPSVTKSITSNSIQCKTLHQKYDAAIAA